MLLAVENQKHGALVENREAVFHRTDTRKVVSSLSSVILQDLLYDIDDATKSYIDSDGSPPGRT